MCSPSGESLKILSQHKKEEVCLSSILLFEKRRRPIIQRQRSTTDPDTIGKTFLLQNSLYYTRVLKNRRKFILLSIMETDEFKNATPI